MDDASYEAGRRDALSSLAADITVQFDDAADTMDDLLEFFRRLTGDPELTWPGNADPSAPQVLVCAVCLYVSEGTAEAAITVISGLAVCEDHASRAQGNWELWRIIAEVRKERRQ
jgi:hypothetical protein